MEFFFRCHTVQSIEARIGQAPTTVPCQTCGAPAARVFTPPYVTEDRTRFWRNAQGTRFSSTFGCDLPDSRSEIQAMAKARGISLDAHDMPHIKRAIELGKAKREGTDISSKEAYAYINEPREPAPSLVETLRKSGKMQAISERIQVGYENWRDRGAMSGDSLASKGAAVLGEGAAVLRGGKPVETT